MAKIKFIGETDDDFTTGEIYELVNIDGDNYFVYAFLTNDNKGISCVPYHSLDTFNENWEVVSNEKKFS